MPKRQAAFVTVKHEIRVDGSLAIHEEQDIVYRESAIQGVAPPSPTAAPSDELWHQEIMPTEVLLFRYSALAFIGHRIHYDKPYATEVEGYPDLVVHGPLIATLLMDLLRRNHPQSTVLDFSFRAVRSSFLGNALNLCGYPSQDGKKSNSGREITKGGSRCLPAPRSPSAPYPNFARKGPLDDQHLSRPVSGHSGSSA
jgi:3-methylfumaryl-CoA hydratase